MARRVRRANDPASGSVAAADVRALRLWRRRLEGMLGFLEELQAGNQKRLAAWRQKMFDHYMHAVSVDLETVPVGGERSAELFRDRLRALSGDGRT